MEPKNFTRIDREYNQVIGYLKQEVKSFSESPEYTQLDDDEQAIPGLVCSAFTNFFIQLEKKSVENSFSPLDEKSLDDCYKLIEKLSSSGDSEIINLVVTEIFENISCSDDVMKRIRQHLRAKSKDLYDKWIL